jgi:uncharacterized protein YjiS (DUF1127 family)
MSRNAVHDPSAAAVRATSRAAPRATPRAGGLVALLGRWLARRRQRRDLRGLARHSAHLLKDIGLERDEALSEAKKPFWR